MRNTLGRFIILAATAVSIGLAEPSTHNLSITVRVYNIAHVPGGVLEGAAHVVTRAYEQAGVAVDWIECPTSATERGRYPGCRDTLGPADLVLRLLPAAPAQFAKQPKVAGAARMSAGKLFANLADIYFDRVEAMTWSSLRSASQGIFATKLAPAECTSLSLGMVIAHEMGHLLLGSHSHSKSGLMKARWSRLELENAYFGRQSFHRRQQNSLQKSVLARMYAE